MIAVRIATAAPAIEKFSKARAIAARWPARQKNGVKASIF
jgi:hypothetical protein